MLSILLHMHQPDYRDPRTGSPTMPWVRLHASRGYRDVPTVVAHTGARVTVNVVPSLIDQWEHYARGGSDTHLDLCRREADTLEDHEVAWVLRNFFHGSPSSFAWFPAWGELKGRFEAGERFDTRRLRDVFVWSNLAWFGFSALRDHPELRELRRKAEGFTEAEKDHVLAVQRSCLQDLPTLYRDLPEVSCTPYYHPILPLLVDTAHAQRSMPGVPNPGFRFPEDARDQLVRARARVEGWLGKPVRGLWPSEGSVSPEVVELAADAGFEWLATDEEILRRSEREGLGAGGQAPPQRPPHGADTPDTRMDVSGPWDLGRMRALFRDRGLSDRIGFTYATWRGEEAAADVLRHTGNVSRLLALDGENPWESYRDAGEHFLKALLGRARTRTCGEMAADVPRGRIRRLHTGSWIGGDFAIWIGHPEDRAGWELLRDAREEWERRGKPESAREHLYGAEGSDWFWWYGDQFSTPFEGEFDRLFRARLAAAWEAMGAPVPAALGEPIKRAATGVRPPCRTLPEDGADWFAWAGAGRIELRAGAMAPVKGMPRALLFGHRATGGAPCGSEVSLRLVPAGDGWRANGVPFVGSRVAIVGNTVVLEGPDGLRVPAEGALTLPIGEAPAGAPER